MGTTRGYRGNMCPCLIISHFFSYLFWVEAHTLQRSGLTPGFILRLTGGIKDHMGNWDQTLASSLQCRLFAHAIISLSPWLHVIFIVTIVYLSPHLLYCMALTNDQEFDRSYPFFSILKVHTQSKANQWEIVLAISI